MEAFFEDAVFTEDEEDFTDELRQLLQYSGATGKLYLAADDGTIRCTDSRSQLLSGEWADDPAVASASGRLPPSILTLSPESPLDITTTLFALNRSGTHAALSGPTLADPELTACFLVDLAGWRPGESEGTGSFEVVPLDAGLLGSRPGLRILQLEWHPDSARHLAILTSDATWRLYDTQRPDVAEQTFELTAAGGGQRRGLGLDALPPVSAPIAFRFGPRQGWERFCIYFLSREGRVHTLCPLTPFHCRYPAHVVEQLQASLEGGVAAEWTDTAEAWVQRAFQPVPPLLVVPGGGTPAPVLEVVTTVPHTLEEHTPALVGPLPVAVAGDAHADAEALLASLLPGPAQDLLLWRGGDGCTALVSAHASGATGAHLLTGEAAPRWLESGPQWVVEGGQLAAVRYQVRQAAPAQQCFPQHLLLLDVVQCGAPTAALQSQPSNAAGEEEWTGVGGSTSRSVALQLDPAGRETLYCCRPAGAFALTLPWLPLLAEALSVEGSALAALPAALPAPAVECLSSGRLGVLCAVPVGDALCGSALVVLQQDSSARCLRAKRAAAPAAAPAVPQAAGGAAAEDADVATKIDQAYGEVLRGPKAAAAQEAGGPHGAATTAAGQRALVESTSALRSTHVEFAHQAHHDLKRLLEEARAEVESQQGAASDAAAAVARAHDRGRAAEARLARAATLHANLAARLRLLAELHWALPRPASRAEVAFAEELPALEAAAARLQQEVAVLVGRVAAWRRQVQPTKGGPAAVAVPPAVPPQQLRRVREVLTEHDRAIRAAQQQAAALAEVLAGL